MKLSVFFFCFLPFFLVGQTVGQTVGHGEHYRLKNNALKSFAHAVLVYQCADAPLGFNKSQAYQACLKSIVALNEKDNRIEYEAVAYDRLILLHGPKLNLCPLGYVTVPFRDVAKYLVRLP